MRTSLTPFKYFITAVLTISALSLTACNKTEQQPQQAAVARPIKLFSAGGLTGEATRKYPGVVLATDRVDLSFQVPGNLINLAVREGQRVNKGDLIAQLEPKDFAASLLNAEGTLAKAKALRTYVEPLITKTKKSEDKEEIMHQHRIVFSHLQDKAAVKELFTVVGPKIASRPGGYTRILKLGIRPGDNAEKAMIELVDFNEIYGKGVDKAAEPAKKTRRGRAPKKAAEVGTAAVAEAPVAEAPVDATETEEKAAE